MYIEWYIKFVYIYNMLAFIIHNLLKHLSKQDSKRAQKKNISPIATGSTLSTVLPSNNTIKSHYTRLPLNELLLSRFAFFTTPLYVRINNTYMYRINYYH